MVKKKNCKAKFFRGINTEVSLPTGSLCSERCAIGSALSSDPSIIRKDLKMICVLALPLLPSEVRMDATTQLLATLTNNQSPLLTSMQSSLPPLSLLSGSPSAVEQSIDENNPIARKKDELKRAPSENDNFILDGSSSTKKRKIGEQTESSMFDPPPFLTRNVSEISATESESPVDELVSSDVDYKNTSIKSSKLSAARKQLLIEQELLFMKLRQEQAAGECEGRNPIDPCGTCNEWLKKIAETNPEFKIVTFTSSDCRTCFVKSVRF
jgi:cytidine deaminase